MSIRLCWLLEQSGAGIVVMYSIHRYNGLPCDIMPSKQKKNC